MVREPIFHDDIFFKADERKIFFEMTADGLADDLFDRNGRTLIGIGRTSGDDDADRFHDLAAAEINLYLAADQHQLVYLMMEDQLIAMRERIVRIRAAYFCGKHVADGVRMPDPLPFYRFKCIVPNGTMMIYFQPSFLQSLGSV